MDLETKTYLLKDGAGRNVRFESNGGLLCTSLRSASYVFELSQFGITYEEITESAVLVQIHSQQLELEFA